MPTIWKEHDLDINGVPLHYRRSGDGSQPALVLAHGFSDSGACWLPVFQEFATNFDVILPDARGHGLSARIAPDEKIDMVADLAGLIQALHLQRPVVGGHSMGGNVAAHLGALYPELARALILEDPAWFDAAPQPVAPPPAEVDAAPPQNPFEARLRKFAPLSVEELIADCHKESPTWPEAELRPWAESKKQFHLGFMTAPRMEMTDWREVVKAITCPTLLITADTDKGAIISPQTAEIVKSLNRLIQVAYVPAAGHSIRRENPAGYLAVVRGFLENR